MLPGFRFLFTAIVLSISMLIFGLGAAAVLRAAHEEFASIPSRRAPPEMMFARQNETKPMLAILRIEPAVDEKIPSATANVQITSPMQQPAVASTAPQTRDAEPDQIAALTDTASSVENSPPSEPAKPETSTAELPIQPEMPPPADTPSSAVETNVAAIAEITSTAPEQATLATPDQATGPIGDSAGIAETNIATLGGPLVAIEMGTSSKRAPAVVKKSVPKKRVVTRHKVASRPRAARPVPHQPANPFAAPFGSPDNRGPGSRRAGKT